MTYEQKLEIVKHAVLEHFKKSITDNWHQMFAMWLDLDSDMVFGYGYKNEFNKEFSQYMTPDIEDILWSMGNNVVCAISAFIKYKKTPELHDVLYFTECFVTSQIDSFTDWCDHIQMAMPDKTSENEDNPV